MQSLSWQEQLAQAIRKPNELLEYVGLDAAAIGYSKSATKQFPVRVPHSFADRIFHKDPDDPILRQVFPYKDEELEVENYIEDPLSEKNVQPLPGLLQKYKSRVLSITTGACAVHCRYCFRRHFPYQDASATHQHWQNSLKYIEQDHSIHEIILSGGDPLTFSDKRLKEIILALSNIEHIKRIRFHTRIPVVLPDRINNYLLEGICNTNKSIVFVIHSNHANELDDNVEKAIKSLHQSNISIFNQSVLLKGVNDTVSDLIKLSEKLVRNNVTPYYLHLMDSVAGAAHYNIDETYAKKLIADMQTSVSGYMVPRLVKEEIGAESKTLIGNYD